jgi:hypothetical protein
LNGVEIVGELLKMLLIGKLREPIK